VFGQQAGWGEQSWIALVIGAGVGTLVGFLPALAVVMLVSIYEWFRIK
jgi:TctA family transporter